MKLFDVDIACTHENHKLSVTVKRTNKANTDIGISWIEIQTCKDCHKQRAIREEDGIIQSTPWVDEICVSVDENDVPTIAYKEPDTVKQAVIEPALVESKEAHNIPIRVTTCGIGDDEFETIGHLPKIQSSASFSIFKVEPHREYSTFSPNKFTVRYMDLTNPDNQIRVISGERLSRLIEENPYVIFYQELYNAAVSILHHKHAS